MGIDDDIRHDTLARERHILLGVGHANRTLLPVPGRELIANLGGSARSHANLDEPKALVVCGQKHLVDDAGLGVFHSRGAVTLGEALGNRRRVILGEWARLPDDDILTTDSGARADQTVVVELVVCPVTHT